MGVLPWKKNRDEPALDDILDELPPSLDSADANDVGAP
jgi:hypothetical protein